MNKKSLTLISFFLFSLFIINFQINSVNCVAGTASSALTYTHFSLADAPLITNKTFKFTISQMSNSTHSQSITSISSISVKFVRGSSNSGGKLDVFVKSIPLNTYVFTDASFQFPSISSETDSVNAALFDEIFDLQTLFSETFYFQFQKDDSNFQYCIITITIVFITEISDEGLVFDVWANFFTFILLILNYSWLGMLVSLFSRKYGFYVASIYTIISLILADEITGVTIFALQLFLIAAEKPKEVKKNGNI